MKKFLMTLLCTLTLGAVGTVSAETLPAEGINPCAERENAVLMQNAYLSENALTVAGNIKLPENGKALADTDIKITMRKMGEKNIDAQADMYEEYSTVAVLLKGESSIGYSLEVPEGEYIIAIEAFGYCENTILGKYYYRADGCTYSEYLAQRVAVTGNTSVDIELVEALNSISGTIELVEPIKDDYVVLEARTVKNTSLNISNRRSTVFIPVEEGQTSVAYTIGAWQGDTRLYVRQGVYKGSSAGSGVYVPVKDEYYFDTAQKSYENTDWELGNYYTYEESENIKIKALYPGGLVCDDTVYAYIYDTDWEYIGIRGAEAKAGEEEIEISIPAQSEAVYIACDRLSGGDVYYYSEEYGVTMNKDAATAVAPESLEGLVLDFSKCFEVSGQVLRNGVLEGTAVSAAVWLESVEGEFRQRIDIPADADGADYKIYVPADMSGMSATLFSQVQSAYMPTDKTELIIDKDIDADTAFASDSALNVTGTLSLSEAAPSKGVAIELEYNNISNYLYIPEGEWQTEYNLDFIKRENYTDGEDICVLVTLYYGDELGRIMPSVWLDMSGEASAVIDLPHDKPLSGKVKLPENIVLTDGVSYSVTAQTRSNNGSGVDYSFTAYGTIEAGSSEDEYEIKIPEGYTVNRLYCSVGYVGNAEIVKSDEMDYTDANGNEIEYGTAIGDGLSGMDFTLKSARRMSGVIALPEGVSHEGVHVWISVMGAESSSSKAILNTGLTGSETAFSAVLPENMTSEFAVSYYVTGSDELYSGTLYVSDNGSVKSLSQATAYNAENGEIIRIAPVKCGLSFDVEVERHSSLNGEAWVSNYTYIILENGDECRVQTFFEPGEEKIQSAKVQFPDLPEYENMTSYKVGYTVSVRTAAGDYGRVYIKENGGITFNIDEAKTFNVGEENSITYTIYEKGYVLGAELESGNITAAMKSATLEDKELEVVVEYSQTVSRQYKPIVVAAVYDSEGRLVQSASEKISLDYTAGAVQTRMVSIPVETGEGYTYKAMLWSSADIAGPVSDVIEF